MAERDMHRLVDVVGDHHGIITPIRADIALVSDGQLRRWSRVGLLDRHGPGVYTFAAASPGWLQLQAAALDVAGRQAAASHRAAARLWGLEGFEDAPVELTAPLGHSRRPRFGILHSSSDLRAEDVVRRDGLAVTGIARTLVDLGAVVSRGVLEIALEEALRRRLVEIDSIDEVLMRVARRGRRGVGPIRKLITERAADADPTESGLETRLYRLLVDGGLPAPVRQFRLWDDGRFIARFDLAYPELKLAIEADSLRWHTAAEQFIKDRTRWAEAEGLGWRVAAFTWHHVTKRPAWVVEAVSRIRRQAARA